MAIKQYKCTLDSDVIINVKSATVGENKTLDFIPGNCFLGIAAGVLYNDKKLKPEEQLKPEEKLLLFHNNAVKFGDAHLAGDKYRTLKVPAAYHTPKYAPGEKDDHPLRVYHGIKNLGSDEIKEQQIKQCKNGFYEFDRLVAKKCDVKKNYAIKSAYDRHTRHSQDEQMFGYESLLKGTVFYFQVEFDDNRISSTLQEKIHNALKGEKRIGRSRTAQFGLVTIAPANYDEIKSKPIKDNKIVTVYADSRLIFLDEYGLPTFQPTEEQLEIKGCKILWDKCQIRTFQYAPWNSQRKAFDADRCGIEKGSVIVLSVEDEAEAQNNKWESKSIGSYQNEGFGRVIYNPTFLDVKFDANFDGEAKYSFPEKDKGSKEPEKAMLLNESINRPLFSCINARIREARLSESIYSKVDGFVTPTNIQLFKGDRFASQWGHIRELAMRYPRKADLECEIFTKVDDNNKPFAYLTHGKAAKKWDEKNRREIFRAFFDGLTEDETQLAIINLASEMAKKAEK
ncbi:MAG: hypothetical protein II956_13960 [Bacteroidales bacterium]|nr:hypothetical protein [Bacteroidales bacterium]